MSETTSQRFKPLTAGAEKPNYTAVDSAVKKILDEFGIDKPPVPIRDIVSSYGIEIVISKFKEEHGDVAGFIHFPTSRIYVNHDDPVNRQTFTVAHEFGHWVLHRELFKTNPEKYETLRRRPIGELEKNPQEKEANAFAAHLLVPRKYLDEYKEIASKDELASLFVVSRDVIANRVNFEYGR